MKNYIGFATAGCIMTMVFFMLVNFITSPNTIWFIYPCFFILFWPISLYFIGKRSMKQFSLFGSIVLLAFLLTENLIHSPDYLWFFYAAFPIISWPVFMYLGKNARTLPIALLGSIITIAYYGLLNFIASPEYPWVIYPAFAIIWWPLSIYHAKRKAFVAFSFTASILISIFFIIVNLISSPDTIWAVYPIFAVIWWPLSMYFYSYKKKQI
ncbi:hypothetical protein AN960_08830 [Bacillus sp. FJAT-25509]|uniref:hypothetical protein n=1 Tax=Bacillaceae TaxID=186817 RepID=UPI0006F49987|nr:hypothetical protein [Bacillus sp. FJAT-25509]KQL40053.1 hypothetical protein AN960_08830 [Bacillus sp. FJAT-25509]